MSVEQVKAPKKWSKTKTGKKNVRAAPSTHTRCWCGIEHHELVRQWHLRAFCLAHDKTSGPPSPSGRSRPLSTSCCPTLLPTWQLFRPPWWLRPDLYFTRQVSWTSSDIILIFPGFPEHPELVFGAASCKPKHGSRHQWLVALIGWRWLAQHLPSLRRPAAGRTCLTLSWTSWLPWSINQALSSKATSN